jgi:hypothetical protein
MTPNQLSSRVSGIVETAEKALEKSVTQTQKALFEQMQILLNKLELDSEGLIKQNQSNRVILSKADGYFDKAFKESGYYQNLDGYSNSIGEITGANSKYFNFVLDSFTVDAQYIKSLQKGAIETIENYLANDGLELSLKQPLKEILNINVNSGASLSDMTKQVREFILGSVDRDGKLMRYSKQISRDTLFNYSSALQESISQKSGLQFYLYSGSSRKDSRDFCVTHANQYYHKKEVEMFASQSWQGKRAGTTSSTIFVYRGGYNCEHSLIPVSEIIVPKNVIERAKQKGLY